MTKTHGLGFGRKPGGRARVTTARSSSEMLIVCRTYNTEVQLKLGDPDEDVPENWGPNLFLNIMSGHRYCSFGLTNHTAQEILALRRMFNIAFDTALEVALNRDAIAEEEAASGNESLLRLHRGVPAVVMRPGIESQHGPCLCDGREVIILGADSGPGHLNGDARSGGPPVAEQQSDEVGTAHPDAQGNQP